MYISENLTGNITEGSSVIRSSRTEEHENMPVDITSPVYLLNKTRSGPGFFV